MSATPLILVEGIRSANYWKQRLSSVPPDARWICYDVRSKAVLEDAGLKVADEEYYFGENRGPLFEIDRTAQTWSASWFEALPERLRARHQAEKFFTRTLNFTFIALLRAFYFLECLREKEGPAQVWTTFCASENGLRWNGEQSPFYGLLRSNNERWGFDTQFHELNLPAEPANPAVGCPTFLYQLLDVFPLPFSNRRVLFSGNPTLLDPLDEALKSQGVSSGAVRIGSRMKDFLFLMHPDKVLFPFQPLLRESPAIPEEDYMSCLRREKAFVFRGADLLEAVWPKLRNAYQLEIPRLQMFFERAVVIFKKLRPEILIVDEDVTEIHRALVMAARSAGIRTLVMIHGLPGAPFGFLPLEADRIAVWGDFSKKILTQWGIDEKRVEVTGSPKYDVLCRAVYDPVIEKRRFFDSMGWDSKKPLVLVIPGGIRTNALEILEEERSSSMPEIVKAAHYFARAAKELPEIQFIFKFRLVDPSHFEIFKKMADSLGSPGNIHWISQGLALDLMRSADLIFNHFSSAALEAVLLRKPVVQMNFSGAPDAYPFAENGLCAEVRDFESVRNLCQRLSRGELPLADWVKSQERLIEPFLLSRDGRSAERVAGMISRWLNPSALPTPAAEAVGNS